MLFFSIRFRYRTIIMWEILFSDLRHTWEQVLLHPGTVLGPNVNVYPTSSVRGYVPAAHIFKAQDRIVKKEA